MEFRECIADANGNLTALNSLKEQVATSVSDCTSALSAAFEDDKLDVAAEETAKLQYLRRMELAIEDLSFKSLSSQE